MLPFCCLLIISNLLQIFTCFCFLECRSSLHEDLPGFENLDQSFCFSPKYQRGTTEFNEYEGDMNSEFQNASSDVQSPGSSRYLKTHAFSPSLGLENDCSSDSELVEHNLEEKDIPSVEVRLSIAFAIT